MAKKPKSIKEMAAQPTVAPGDPKTMQQLLQSFAPDGEGNLCREFETKTDEGHFSPLAMYRQLLVAIGATIGPLKDGASIENGQGITLTTGSKSKITTECTMKIPPVPFMKIAATYGFDATGKLPPEFHEQWKEIQVQALSAKAAASLGERKT